MKVTLFLPILLVVTTVTLAISLSGFQQKTKAEPWKENQLMAPEALAKTLDNPLLPQPTIISVGPGAVIKGSLDIGPANEKENYDKLRLELNKLSKDADIVIYCGCCPFAHCPNIRPAFTLLNEMKFTNHQLLNIQHNIKTDWISKGYPVNK